MPDLFEPGYENSGFPIVNFALPAVIIRRAGARCRSLDNSGQIQGMEAGTEIPVSAQLNFAEPQGKADQAGRVDDEEIAIDADAVAVPVPGEHRDNRRVFAHRGQQAVGICTMPAPAS